MAEKRGLMTEGSIAKQLILFAIPLLIGNMFQQLYNTVDALIVGNFLGKEALAAVGGTTSTYLNLYIGFFVGLSAGATVLISQYFGSNDHKAINKTVHTAITLAEGILENLDRKDKWVMGTLTAPDGTVTGTTECAANEMPVSAIRRDEVPGIHTITYESEADSIIITHDAKNRKGFALGAVLAAEYTAEHTGFLGMNDLFNF